MTEKVVFPTAPLYPEFIPLDESLRKDVRHMLEKIDCIKKDLKHNNKLKKRFNKCKNIWKYLGYGLFGVLIAGDIVVSIFLPGIAVPIVLAGTALGEFLISEIVSGYFGKKKSVYTKKCKHIQTTLDKMDVFIRDAVADKKIEEAEIKRFQVILNEYEEGVVEIKEESKNEEKYTLKELQSLLSKKQNGYI